MKDVTILNRPLVLQFLDDDTLICISRPEYFLICQNISDMFPFLIVDRRHDRDEENNQTVVSFKIRNSMNLTETQAAGNC